MTESPITTVRRRFAAKIARMSPEEACAALGRIRAEGATIFHADIRALTGGYNSQSLNAQVIRRLAERAGIARKQARQ